MNRSESPSNAHETKYGGHPSARVIVLISFSMLAVLFIMGSQDRNQINQTLMMTPTTGVEQTITPIPSVPSKAASMENSEYTTGLIFGAILLLLIIILGTLAVIRHKD